jgi:prevent-host-death family protein
MDSITKSVGAFDAKTHLSQYLDQVEKGERIEITRRGKPVACLVPAQKHYPSSEELDQLIHRVRERSESYGITLDEIQEWKKEGRR